MLDRYEMNRVETFERSEKGENKIISYILLQQMKNRDRIGSMRKRRRSSFYEGNMPE